MGFNSYKHRILMPKKLDKFIDLEKNVQKLKNHATVL